MLAVVRFICSYIYVEAVIFISCKPPVDPVELVVKYIKSVEDTGCVANAVRLYTSELELISYIN